MERLLGLDKRWERGGRGAMRFQFGTDLIVPNWINSMRPSLGMALHL